MSDIELAEILYGLASEFHPKDDPDLDRLLQARGIEKFYHFTSIENLESIFQHGFLGRNSLEDKNLEYSASDYSRDEPINNGICFSISRPNEYMLLHKISNGRKLVLLELENVLDAMRSSVFIALPGNFGSHIVKENFQQWPEKFVGGEGLVNLFLNDPLRSKFSLKSHEPTDPRSEIVFLTPVDHKYIKRIISPPDLEYASQEKVRSLISKLPIGVEFVSQSQELFQPLNWKDSAVQSAYFERTWSPAWS
jgi:hypothetical protein